MVTKLKTGTSEDFEARYKEYTCKQHGRIFAKEALTIHISGLNFDMDEHAYCLRCLVDVLDKETEARVVPK